MEEKLLNRVGNISKKEFRNLISPVYDWIDNGNLAMFVGVDEEDGELYTLPCYKDEETSLKDCKENINDFLGDLCSDYLKDDDIYRPKYTVDIFMIKRKMGL